MMARLDARARKHSTRRVRRRYDKAGGARSRAWRDAHFPSPLVGEGCKAWASQLENGGRRPPTPPSPTRREGRREPPSPRPERRGAEQILLLMRRGPPIGRRRRDMAAEFVCARPAPARVVEHPARQCDHVGLAGCDDILSLPRLRDETDRNGVDANSFLQRLRKRHLIAGAERNLLQR